MIQLTIYVSGPIMGYPDQNILAFQNAALFIRRAGHEPLIPHDIDPHFHGDNPCPRGYNTDGGHSSACWLRMDILTMLEQAEAVYMLGDWERSQGARLEHQVAALCGLGIYYEFGKIPLPPINITQKDS